MNNQERFSGKWETKRLEEISDVNPQNFSSNTNPNYKFNYITLEQVDSGKLLGYSEEVFRTAPSRAQRILQNGDVLMSTVRPNLMAHLFFHGQVPNAVCSTGFAVLRAKHDSSVPYFLFSQLFSEGVNDQIDTILSGSNYPAINSRDVKLIEIPCPPQVLEQRAIAEVLSDVDGLINALDALIAKKRAIKQATMQQLLTGKTRLPGFSGEWETKRLGDVAQIKTGSKNNEDKDDNGQYPLYVRSAVVERINSYCFDGEAILVPGEGGIENIFHYINGRFDCHQRVYMINRFVDDVFGKLIYYIMVLQFGKYAMQNTVKATVDSLRLPTFQTFSFSIPKDVAEQRAIATVLSDMGAEIAALEQRRDKTIAIKQGMMQQLLTGQVRLMESKT